MSKPIYLEDYNPQWEKEFEKLKQYLMAMLHDSTIDIMHIGSTSVKGMVAKPIIDLVIVYQTDVEHIIDILQHHNYEYLGFNGIQDRHAFKYMKDDFYEHHLYAVQQGLEPLRNWLLLKNALKRSQKNRQMYSELKRHLVQVNNIDREWYTESKTDLINQIMKEEQSMKSIVFAGGCFWGVEAYFKQLEGVTDTEVGYINGDSETTYEEVCNGSGHAEAVYILYDEEIISLKKLLDHLFNIIDPTSINKQGNDKGIQYRTGIYNYLPEQLSFIKNYIKISQENYDKPIVIELETNLQFFNAETYHQDYLAKNKGGYCHVDLNSHKNVK